MAKQVCLNTFSMNTVGHLSPGLWRHQTRGLFKREYREGTLRHKLDRLAVPHPAALLRKVAGDE